MAPKSRTADEVIASIAGANHGVVTRGGLLAAGVSPDEIRHRAGSGSLIRVHRGVYRAGHAAPSLRAQYMGGVLAGGDGALLAGRANAYLLALGRGRPPTPEVLTKTQRAIPGVITHRSRHLDSDAWEFDGIPCTTVARTLVDLAAILGSEALARTCHEAMVRYRTRPDQVEAVLERRPSSRGATTLRRVLRGDAPVTLSVLERRFLALLNEAGLPEPRTNRPAGGRYVDCRWPAHALTVELDSYRFHASRHAWERDHRREREAYARGDAFRRYSYGDVCERPRSVIGELQAVLPPTPGG